jgi:hypothetical protein
VPHFGLSPWKQKRGDTLEKWLITRDPRDWLGFESMEAQDVTWICGPMAARTHADLSETLHISGKLLG